MNLNDRNIVLASKSPRRKELLENIGLKFSVKPAEIEEIHRGVSGFGEIVMDLAEQKGEAVGKLMFHDRIIIASDTIVVIDGEILNKPEDRDHAFKMLRQISGRTHSVFTSLYVYDGYLKKTVKEYTETKVEFYELTDEQINDYLDTHEPFDKAGAYGIQGYGSKFIKKIDGCFFSVMGFPVPLFSQKMYKFGYLL
ncbi:MAG TPA: Maf family protein [Clostridiales bacterium]|nr:Maf family protein [Clostridiales bacterium]HQP70972.1 Maf family protein [Clostridiales bacterium]